MFVLLPSSGYLDSYKGFLLISEIGWTLELGLGYFLLRITLKWF